MFKSLWISRDKKEKWKYVNDSSQNYFINILQRKEILAINKISFDKSTGLFDEHTILLDKWFYRLRIKAD